MRLWPFSKKQEKQIDIQDYSLSGALSFLYGITSSYPTNILPLQAYQLAEMNADLGDAIDRIASSVAELKCGIALSEQATVYEHPLLSLLQNPGYTVSTSQFWKELTESYLLTSEVWVVARGSITRPPVELCFIRPYYVSVIFSQTDGLPLEIQTQTTRDRRSYYRQIIQGRMRFIDDRKLNEIIPIIGTTSLADDWRGRSKLVKLFYDLEMGTDGKRHNVAMLKNGMRPSAIISPPSQGVGAESGRWTGDVVEKISDVIQKFHSGTQNSGSSLVLSRSVQIDGLTQNNKDMDYVSLLSKSQTAIYNLYKIPLAKILPDAMTLDNYTTANRVYYTEAVFPVFDEIGTGLIAGLGTRFALSPDARLIFSEVNVRNLQPILVENMKRLKDSEVVSINEIRKTGGFEDVVGGEVILVSSNKVPFTSVMNAEEPTDEEIESLKPDELEEEEYSE